jgi:hypothetical protein
MVPTTAQGSFISLQLAIHEWPAPTAARPARPPARPPARQVATCHLATPGGGGRRQRRYGRGQRHTRLATSFPPTPLTRPATPLPLTPNPQVEPFLDHAITRHYLSSAGIPDQSGKIIAEYVWIGGTGADLRSKVRGL